jgi:hypothetical protein
MSVEDLVPTEIQSLDHPAHSKLLYGLRYPGLQIAGMQAINFYTITELFLMCVADVGHRDKKLSEWVRAEYE